MEPSPTKVTTTTEVINGETHVTNTTTGTTVSTVCVVTLIKPFVGNFIFKGDYPFWDQPVQDHIDNFTAEGEYNFIGVINDNNRSICSMKFPSLEIMQMGMEEAGNKFGFKVPTFDIPSKDLKIDYNINNKTSR